MQKTEKRLKKIEDLVSNYRLTLVSYALLYNTLIWVYTVFRIIAFRHQKLLKNYDIDSDIASKLSQSLYNTGLVQTYTKFYPDVSDKDGFIMYDKCDSLLFSALAWASGRNVNIELAEDKKKKGLWNRRSMKYNSCYPQYSRSTISRDMIIGLMIGAFVRRRFDILLDLHRYGRANYWIMGKGSVSKVHLGSNLESLLGLCLSSVKFKNQFNKLSQLEQMRIRLSTWKPITYSKDLKGYQFHLQTLVVILKMLATEECQSSDTAGLEGGDTWHYGFANAIKMIVLDSIDTNEDLSKARFHYSDKWIKDNLRKYPKDRLPNYEDVATHWIWEGHTSTELDTTYTGCDVLFIHKILSEFARI